MKPAEMLEHWEKVSRGLLDVIELLEDSELGYKATPAVSQKQGTGRCNCPVSGKKRTLNPI